MTLLRAKFVKNSVIWARIYFIFLKNVLKQTWTSVKSSEKQLPNKFNFGTVLLLNCSNFRLKQCERPWSYQNCQRN